MLEFLLLFCFLSGIITSSESLPTKDKRIVGGWFAEITDYPWLLSLQRSKKHYCGGCIISPYFSLTAATCIVGETLSTLRVRAGSSTHGSGGELRPVAAAYVHDKYNSTTYDYDIAVLKVEPNFEVGLVKIQRAFLPNAGYYPKSGTILKVAGWGIVGSLGTIIPGGLRDVSVPAVARDTCRVIYGNNKTVTDRMMCAGYESGDSKGACDKDTGGPLIENTTVVGIITWRQGCEKSGYPGIYTDVAAVRDWIVEITGL